MIEQFLADFDDIRRTGIARNTLHGGAQHAIATTVRNRAGEVVAEVTLVGPATVILPKVDEISAILLERVDGWQKRVDGRRPAWCVIAANRPGANQDPSRSRDPAFASARNLLSSNSFHFRTKGSGAVLMATIPSFQHATPAYRTFCGVNALAALPRELDRLGCQRAVIVGGPWLVALPDVLGAIESAMGSRLAGRFDDVVEHSPVPTVEAARKLLEDVDADAVIAVGGGSSIVTARAATILLAEKKDARELSTRRGADGKLISPRLVAPKIPNWVIPSTPITAYAKAGSAVSVPETGERLALFDPKTRAQGIFLDPAVALTAPVGLASTRIVERVLDGRGVHRGRCRRPADRRVAAARTPAAHRVDAAAAQCAGRSRAAAAVDARRAALRPGQ